MPQLTEQLKEATDPAKSLDTPFSAAELADAEGDKKKTPPRKVNRPKQAFNVPKNKKIKELIKKNSESSRLLQLPRELRNKIFRYAVGDKLIHIRYIYVIKYGTTHWTKAFKHTICEATTTEDEAHELMHSDQYDLVARSFTKFGKDMRVESHRHTFCNRRLLSCIQANITMDLDILLTCRQVYVDVNPILWSTNTWSFDSSRTFIRWASMRNATQRRSLKKVHITEYFKLFKFPQSSISKFGVLDELLLDFVGKFPVGVIPEIPHFIPAKKIRILFPGPAAYVNKVYKYLNGEFERGYAIGVAEEIVKVMIHNQKTFQANAKQKMDQSKKMKQDSDVGETLKAPAKRKMLENSEIVRTRRRRRSSDSQEDEK